MASPAIEFRCAMCGDQFRHQTDVEDHMLRSHRPSVRAMS